MQINVYPYPAAITEKQYFGKTAIVVDVLRSSTCMVEALKNGATQLIPARDAGEAMAFAVHLGRRESLLAGENGGVAMQGFDLGNSPQEFREDVVQGKTVVFCTSNGTGAIHAARTAANLLIGCLRNCTATAKKAAGYENDIIIICAGTAGESSLDDMIAAGGILQALVEEYEAVPEMNDFAKVCGYLYSAWRSGEVDIASAKHYNTLVKLGFESDIAYCLAEDKTDCVPRYDNGSIK